MKNTFFKKKINKLHSFFLNANKKKTKTVTLLLSDKSKIGGRDNPADLQIYFCAVPFPQRPPVFQFTKILMGLSMKMSESSH